MNGKMRGHIGTGGRCPVEGHGEGCELNRELREERLGRAQEKREWLRADVLPGEPLKLVEGEAA